MPPTDVNQALKKKFGRGGSGQGGSEPRRGGGGQGECENKALKFSENAEKKEFRRGGCIERGAGVRVDVNEELKFRGRGGGGVGRVDVNAELKFL